MVGSFASLKVGVVYIAVFVLLAVGFMKAVTTSAAAAAADAAAAAAVATLGQDWDCHTVTSTAESAAEVAAGRRLANVGGWEAAFVAVTAAECTIRVEVVAETARVTATAVACRTAARASELVAAAHDTQDGC